MHFAPLSTMFVRVPPGKIIISCSMIPCQGYLLPRAAHWYLFATYSGALNTFSQPICRLPLAVRLLDLTAVST